MAPGSQQPRDMGGGDKSGPASSSGETHDRRRIRGRPAPVPDAGNGGVRAVGREATISVLGKTEANRERDQSGGERDQLDLYGGGGETFEPQNGTGTIPDIVESRLDDTHRPGGGHGANQH